MTRMLRVAAALLLLGPGLAEAQGSPPLVKYGKWLLVAGAVGMNLAAADAHRTADAAFGQLTDRCTQDQSLCALGDGGAYADPESERLYQESLRFDRLARLWLASGETAALGAAVMFVWEFARPKHPPGNIPFEPKVAVRSDRTELGLLVRF